MTGSVPAKDIARVRRLPDAARALYSLEEVAVQLNVSMKTARRMVKSGELAHVRVGKLIRIEAAELALYIARRRMVGTTWHEGELKSK